MLIAEIFNSIQGEGLLTGEPSVFVRTSGCNLRCSWCDTMYASWEPEGEEMEVGQVVEKVCSYAETRVVITGGDPMIAKGLDRLATLLSERGRHITIETAGTVSPSGIACDLASLSPKLSGSVPRPGEIAAGWIEKHEQRRLRPDIIADWVRDYDYQLKFVVCGEGDVAEIADLLSRVRDEGVEVPPEKVLLMPEGTDVETLRSRDDLISAACRQYGYGTSRRLHIELFGNTRGT
jgi:7-carboxy-7-deazaguanine synthase